jgi:hypothetical protein
MIIFHACAMAGLPSALACAFFLKTVRKKIGHESGLFEFQPLSKLVLANATVYFLAKNANFRPLFKNRESQAVVL